MGILSRFKCLKITDPERRPRVSKSNADDQKMLSSQLIYETVKGSHEFKIKRYSLSKGMGVGKKITSTKFTVGGYDWVMLFYPDGIYRADKKEYVSLFIKSKSRGKVRTMFEFKLLDQSGKAIHDVEVSQHPVTFCKGFEYWGMPQYMKKSELESSNFLKDDCLIIHCTVEVVKARVKTVQTRVEEGKHIFRVPPSDMIQNLKGLLESEIGSDITFQVGNELFRAHKSILAARSRVFRAQFFGQVGDPNMETITIEEFEPFAFKAMLLYLYSDELPQTHELSDLDSLCTSTTIMQHLLAAADRFDLPRLKVMCEAKLYEEISTNTVATTLVIADTHQSPKLKTACLNFAARLENLEVCRVCIFGEVMSLTVDRSVEDYCSGRSKINPNTLQESDVKNNNNTCEE